MIFRTLSERTTGRGVSGSVANGGLELSRTFLLANIFQGECEAGILSLDNSNFAEGTLAYHTKKSEMIKVD